MVEISRLNVNITITTAPSCLPSRSSQYSSVGFAPRPMPSFNTIPTSMRSPCGNGVHCCHFLNVTFTDHDNHRPLTAQGERVTPSDLRDHRLSNRFLGPCCVCPIIAEGQPAFTEAAIFVVLSGRFAGEYVTECAQNRCGYFGT